MSGEQKKLLQNVQQLRWASSTAGETAVSLYANQQLEAGDMAIALKSGGYLAAETLGALADMYKLSPKDTAKNMRDAGYIAMSVAPKLRDMGLSMNEVVRVLREVGYSASDAGLALRNVYAIVQIEDTIRVLNAAGYSATEIALYANKIANTPVHIVAQIFNKLGLPAKEVANALSTAYDLATQVVIAQALKYAKYSAEQVASAMEDLYHLGAKGMSELLKQAGYAANEVANVLKNIYRQTAEMVAQVLKTVYNMGGEAVEAVLKGVGYAADQIKNAMSSVFDWFKKNLDPSNW